jgi:hypothetical protein
MVAAAARSASAWAQATNAGSAEVGVVGTQGPRVEFSAIVAGKRRPEQLGRHYNPLSSKGFLVTVVQLQRAG